MTQVARATRAKDDPLKVVHVITSLTTGGAERQLELLVNRSEHRTATIALYAGGPVADSLRCSGHRVEVLGMDGWRKLVAPLRLARRLRRYRPDVVHVHLLAAQLWGIPAARLAGVPVVVSSEHSLMDDTIEGRPHTWWLRLLYRVLERMTTHTVAVSATTAGRLHQWGVADERITVVDNGIDFERLAFDPAARRRVRDELGLDDGVTVIGVVGRLDPVKRIDTILRAAAPLLRDGRHLVVAGTGPLWAELRALSARLGVADAVSWLGARGDVDEVLSAMDLLVSASADETFGMAVVEAVGSGLPVVYVQCPALEELPEDVPGAVRVAQGDGQDLDVRLLTAALVAQLDGLQRWPVPAVLGERYGAVGAAAGVDCLHRALMERARA